MENDRNSVLLNEEEIKKTETITAETSPVVSSSLSKRSYYLDALNETEVNKLVKDTRPELIVLLGLNDFGKSTFCGSLYHLLRTKGSLGNYVFIDSETFIGWERRVYLRRVENDGPSTTKRTIRGESSFLHLKMQVGNTHKFFETVFSDSSGEVYRDYISNDELIEEDRTIEQADKLLLFIDSSKLYGQSYRSLKDAYISLMHRLKAKGKLSSHAIVYLIFNKEDLKNEAYKKRNDHEEAITNIVKEAFDGKEIKIERINSKSLDDNQHLEDFFITILTPIDCQQDNIDIDWVNNSI